MMQSSWAVCWRFSFAALISVISSFTVSDRPQTSLCPHLQGIDPNDAFSSVPYEKGFNFLTYLETLVGGEEVMNPFLKAHCQQYAHKTVNLADWKVFFFDNMTNTAKVSAEKLASIDWDA
jgi:leukotriene-A4 hydrolase